MLNLTKLTKDLTFESIDEVIGGSDNSSSSSSCSSSSSSSSSAGVCGGMEPDPVDPGTGGTR